MTRKILTIHYGKEGAKIIPNIPLITVQPTMLNARLWELVERENSGIITPDEKRELNDLCIKLENQA